MDTLVTTRYRLLKRMSTKRPSGVLVHLGAMGVWLCPFFGLKNAGAMYQRAINLLFHDMIGLFMEIYIDDVKSTAKEQHLANWKRAFERIRLKK